MEIVDVWYHNLTPCARVAIVKEKHRRTRRRIDALEGATHWTDAEALLLALGAERYEGGGSTVTFVLGGRKLTVDRPHPRRECGMGLVKRLRRFLAETAPDDPR